MQILATVSQSVRYTHHFYWQISTCYNRTAQLTAKGTSRCQGVWVWGVFPVSTASEAKFYGFRLGLWSWPRRSPALAFRAVL